jgi:hypothetical protein
MALNTYVVNVKGTEWEKEITHISAGKAKSRYLREVRESWDNVAFRDLTCRSLGAVNTPPEFLAMAEKRQIPFAHYGMKVRVGDDFGVIVGYTASANLEILFTSGKGKDHVLSCHPQFMIAYYDEQGNILKEFKG